MINIKELCKENNITQVELANILGINKSAISQWQVGNISVENIIKISRLFNIPIDDILSEEKDIQEFDCYKYYDIDYESLTEESLTEFAQRLENDLDVFYNSKVNNIILDNKKYPNLEKCFKRDYSRAVLEINNRKVVYKETKSFNLMDHLDDIYKNNIKYNDWYVRNIFVFKWIDNIKLIKNEMIKIKLLSIINLIELDVLTTYYFYNRQYEYLEYAFECNGKVLNIRENLNTPKGSMIEFNNSNFYRKNNKFLEYVNIKNYQKYLDFEINNWISMVRNSKESLYEKWRKFLIKASHNYEQTLHFTGSYANNDYDVGDHFFGNTKIGQIYSEAIEEGNYFGSVDIDEDGVEFEYYLEDYDVGEVDYDYGDYDNYKNTKTYYPRKVMGLDMELVEDVEGADDGYTRI